ncbi:Interleukin-1 receptor-associated kinase [Entamoeba marina]
MALFKKTKLIDLVKCEDRVKVKDFLSKKKNKKLFEDFANFKEQNPLYVALITKKNLEISKELLKAMVRSQADINKCDEKQQTVLHYACNTFITDAQFILALLETPTINVNAKNSDQQTPLHIFCQKFANVQSYKAVLQTFVKLGAEIDAKSRFLETPLMKTVKNTKLRGLVAQFLLDNGANVNTANKSNNTILHLVVQLNRVDLVTILLKSGANIYHKNNNNETPLDLATKQCSNNMIVKLREVDDLVRWLTSISDSYAERYSIKFINQELHPKLLQSLTDKELQDVLECISVNSNDVSILMESLKSFTVSGTNELDKQQTDNLPEPQPSNYSRRSSLPVGFGSWTIDSSRIEFTGETKSSKGKEVGKGSTCTVYRGIYKKDTNNGSSQDISVAVKIMNDAEEISENSEVAREFEVQQAVRHKNIVKFFGMVVDENVSVVMEFCSRFSFFNVLNDPNQTIDFPTALNFCTQLAVGLNALHSHSPSILHRDFKSLNVLVSEDYTLKISDFGLSRFDTEENRNNELKEMQGTIAYMCPEIIPGENEPIAYSTKSDIYSLGIVLWELFNRVVFGSYTKPWFDEYNIAVGNDFPIIQFILDDKRPTLHVKDYENAQINSVPPLVHELYYRCVDIDPTKRPSASEIINLTKAMETEYHEQSEIWEKYYVPSGYKKI